MERLTTISCTSDQFEIYYRIVSVLLEFIDSSIMQEWAYPERCFIIMVTKCPVDLTQILGSGKLC
jgi:hypothetical protein